MSSFGNAHFLPNPASKWLLLAGVLGITAAHLTYGVGCLGWVSSVPFLVFLAATKGLKQRLLFALALVVAWSAATAKIITPPIPFGLVFLFSVPIALIHLPGYLLWARFRERAWSLWLFPAVMVLMEWVQYSFMPFASWGVAAYLEADNTALLQSLSLFGMPGLSFLIYWVNVSIAEILLRKKTTIASFQMPLAFVLALMVFGTLRLAIANSNGRDSIAVAAVGTNSEVSNLPLATVEQQEKFKSALFSRTKTAAAAGAKLVVWNEAALVILPEDEADLKNSLLGLASQNGIALVAAYVVVVTQAPLKFDNKYLFIDPKGGILYSYQKHEPVPGEPSMKGSETLQVFPLDGVNIGGAICYDYDYPYLAKGFGKLGADIVAVPSSDWRGIDPIHTQMAAFRAIEQGHSVLRSTRFGLSAAINPWGEMTARMSSFDQNDRTMLAQLPRKGVWTLYGLVGDILVYGCMFFLAWFFAGNRRMKSAK